MTETIKFLFAAFAILLAVGAVLGTASASALVMGEASADSIYPGEEGSLRVTIENPGDDVVEDVVLSLSFTDPLTKLALPLSSAGSSSASADEIDDDDSEDFTFRIKASGSAVPGEYNIPYTLTYDGLAEPQTGTIGVTITGDVSLDYTVSAENPIIGQKGAVLLSIINKGLADAKFVSVKIHPVGYTLLSEEEIYVGTISSDDFETIKLDVIFKSSPTLDADIEYKDFDNNAMERSISLPVRVYTHDKAIELGILKQSYKLIYLLVAAIVVVLWLIFRAVRKRRRLARSREIANRAAQAESSKLKEGKK